MNECVHSESRYVTFGEHYVFDGVDAFGNVTLLQDDDGDNYDHIKDSVIYQFHHRPKS